MNWKKLVDVQVKGWTLTSMTTIVEVGTVRYTIQYQYLLVLWHLF